MFLTGEEAYAVYQAFSLEFMGETVTPWEDLSWSSRDEWQAVADEVNEGKNDDD